MAATTTTAMIIVETATTVDSRMAMVVAQEATRMAMTREESAIALQQKIIIMSTSQTRVASGRIIP